MAARIRKGDLVRVINGTYYNKNGEIVTQGKVDSVDHETQRAVVEGVNMRPVKIRPDKRSAAKQIVLREQPIHLSNLAPILSEGGKGGRVRYETQTDADGKTRKVRVLVGRTMRDENGKALRNSDGSLKKEDPITLG